MKNSHDASSGLKKKTLSIHPRQVHVDFPAEQATFLLANCPLGKAADKSHCAVPENIHTHHKEGHWKFQGGRRGSLKSQNIIVKRKYETKLEFPEGWGLKPKNPQWEGYGSFLGQHISIQSPLVRWISVFFFFSGPAVFSL